MGAAGSGRVAFESTDVGTLCESLEDVRWLVVDATEILKALDQLEVEIRSQLDKLHAKRQGVRRLLLTANLKQAGIEQGLGMPHLRLQHFHDELAEVPMPSGDVTSFMDNIRERVRDKVTA